MSEPSAIHDPQPSIKLLVVDDHPVVRAGVRAMLSGTGIDVVAEAEGSDQAVVAAGKARPDVVLMAVRLIGADGIETIARLRANGCQAPVICFSSFDNPTYIARAISMGAAGYLLKTATRKQLLETLQTAARGETCWTPRELKRHTGVIPADRLQGFLEVTLTSRESEVLKQLAFGLTNKEIASALGLRYDTVKEHVQHVLRKLGVGDRTQAAVWAVRRGLV